MHIEDVKSRLRNLLHPYIVTAAPKSSKVLGDEKTYILLAFIPKPVAQFDAESLILDLLESFPSFVTGNGYHAYIPLAKDYCIVAEGIVGKESFIAGWANKKYEKDARPREWCAEMLLLTYDDGKNALRELEKNWIMEEGNEEAAEPSGELIAPAKNEDEKDQKAVPARHGAKWTGAEVDRLLDDWDGWEGSMKGYAEFVTSQSQRTTGDILVPPSHWVM